MDLLTELKGQKWMLTEDIITLMVGRVSKVVNLLGIDRKPSQPISTDLDGSISQPGVMSLVYVTFTWQLLLFCVHLTQYIQQVFKI